MLIKKSKFIHNTNLSYFPPNEYIQSSDLMFKFNARNISKSQVHVCQVFFARVKFAEGISIFWRDTWARGQSMRQIQTSGYFNPKSPLYPQKSYTHTFGTLFPKCCVYMGLV